MVWPINPTERLRKKKSMLTALRAKPQGLGLRLAILGGSTTAELRDQMEISLREAGFDPQFWEGEYKQWFEDAVFGNPGLDAFKPDLIFIHTSQANVSAWPGAGDSSQAVDELFEREAGRFRQAWDALAARFNCPILQNNFDLPPYRLMGSRDAVDPRGKVHFVARLNALVAERAAQDPSFHLHDLNHLAAWYGLRHWHDRRLWHMAKVCCAQEAIPYLAHSVCALIGALYGKSKKLLVLDMDNTLWGGVIGDDGLDGIQIGQDNPEAEAFTEMQAYARELKSRGVLLAVASKNEDANARLGLSHPDSVLREDDFAAFRANWDPKPDNIRSMGHSLSLGTDSFVFLDDNPVERDLVRAQAPEVAVPEAGEDPTLYPGILDRSGWFESAGLSKDDLSRSGMYKDNAQRDKAQGAFADYGQFLDSLQMQAEIAPFVPLYLDRITQLANKSNQFNLTTRRYTQPEIEAVAADPACLPLYGRLKDRFGDNGLVSVVIGRQAQAQLHLELWLMSCRVLKRGMEDAMLDAVVARARERGITELVGTYLPTAKNGMVRDFYGAMGFERVSLDEAGKSVWRLPLAGFQARQRHILVLGDGQAL